MWNLEDSIEWIGYTVNDLNNAISVIDYNSPMIFFEIAKEMGKVIKGGRNDRMYFINFDEDNNSKIIVWEFYKKQNLLIFDFS